MAMASIPPQFYCPSREDSHHSNHDYHIALTRITLNTTGVKVVEKMHRGEYLRHVAVINQVSGLARLTQTLQFDGGTNSM